MNRSAVIIGVNRTGRLPSLQAAVTSAHAVAQWATDQGFTTVDLITDEGGPVTLQRIKTAIAPLVGTTEKLLVYFSGHGVNIHMNEYWLLTDAPIDPQAAVNVSGSEVLARQVGIDHVIFVSDACRTAADTIQAQYVSGGEIFPNQQVSGPARGVDLFFATSLGAPALEVRDATKSAAQFKALYTDVLVQALRGKCNRCVTEIQEAGKSVGVVRPWPLRMFLQDEIPRRFAATARTTGALTPIPDARITSPPTAWLARVPTFRVDLTTTQIGESGLEIDEALRAIVQPDDDSAQTLAQARAQPQIPPPHPSSDQQTAVTSWRIPGVMSPIALPRGTRAPQLNREAQRHSTAFGPTNFETRCGFKVRGALFQSAEAALANAKVDVGPQKDVVFVCTASQPTSVVLEFDNGRCAVLPAIPDFIASLTIEHGGLVDVVYEPSDNSSRWPEYQSRMNSLRRLRGQISAAAKFGVFRPQDADADAMAREMQLGQGVDPTMAIYAAYAYHALNRLDRLWETVG